MALIKCTKCGKEISDKSSECVNCGNSMQNIMEDYKKVKKKKKIKIVAVFIIFVFVIISSVELVNIYKSNNPLGIKWGMSLKDSKKKIEKSKYFKDLKIDPYEQYDDIISYNDVNVYGNNSSLMFFLNNGFEGCEGHNPKKMDSFCISIAPYKEPKDDKIYKSIIKEMEKIYGKGVSTSSDGIMETSWKSDKVIIELMNYGSSIDIWFYKKNMYDNNY